MPSVGLLWYLVVVVAMEAFHVLSRLVESRGGGGGGDDDGGKGAVPCPQ